MKNSDNHVFCAQYRVLPGSVDFDISFFQLSRIGDNAEARLVADFDFESFWHYFLLPN